MVEIPLRFLENRKTTDANFQDWRSHVFAPCLAPQSSGHTHTLMPAARTHSQLCKARWFAAVGIRPLRPSRRPPCRRSICDLRYAAPPDQSCEAMRSAVLGFENLMPLTTIPDDAWKGRGRLAQLVERHVYTVDVGGSNPSSPTSNSPSSLNRAALSPGINGGR